MTDIPDDLVETLMQHTAIPMTLLKGHRLHYSTSKLACAMTPVCPITDDQNALTVSDAPTFCDTCPVSYTNLTPRESISNLVAYLTADNFSEMWSLRTGGRFIPDKPTHRRRKEIMKRLMFAYNWCKQGGNNGT